ncbi:MAG: cyclic nucleotide-binding protein [Hyphomicrobiales bacterium]|nr:MAG: cyclic nucleotide-binding protein [Hyphomicrobiales bacterium]
MKPGDFETVQKSTVFSGVDEESLQELLRGAAVRSYERGQMIFVQGDPADAFFVVLEGWLKIFRVRESGEEIVIHVFSRGDSIAEAAAFTSGLYPASCEAVSDCRVLRVPADRLLDRIRRVPDIAIAMLASTSMHLHSLIREIEEIRGMSGTQRVAQFLLSLGDEANGQMIVRMPFEKNLIANRLAMTPYSLSRAFSKLRDFGVRIDHSTAEISDVSALRALIAREQRAGN